MRLLNDAKKRMDTTERGILLKKYKFLHNRKYDYLWMVYNHKKSLKIPKS